MIIDFGVAEIGFIFGEQQHANAHTLSERKRWKEIFTGMAHKNAAQMTLSATY